MTAPARTFVCALAALAGLAPASAFARATVTIQIEQGDALSDPTPAEPVGGNTGTTLGEQRKLALDYAARMWGERLDSDVPITVGVTFEALPCSGAASVLGAAATTALFSGVTGAGANPNFYYPSALANKLSGQDLDPSEPEIRMQLNSDVDASCKAATGGFYYGFDERDAQGVDFAQTVLHELAHGLGLASFADPETGELFSTNGVDPYTSLVRDLDRDQLWPALTDAQRATSAGDLRRVAWDGQRARAAAAEVFAKGTPSVTFTPTVSGFSGIVSDSSFGENSAQHPVEAPLTTASNEGCSSLIGAGVDGTVVLLRPGHCSVAMAARFAKEAGAVGALIASTGSPFSAPAQPLDVEAGAVALPVVAVTDADASRIVQALMAGPVRAALGGAANQLLGGDDAARPLLFASQPVSASSSISHLEPLIRPQQLMEPINGPIPTHDVSFTLTLLADLGWQLTCGNGVIDSGEACDDGPKNSDTLPDRCRSNCQRARCGDGVRDSNEACDGTNDDRLANACRSSCQLPKCGDGVIDDGEACDDGANNGTAAGACRPNCRAPSCGDGIVDPGEECDDGAKNSDSRAGACRTQCKTAYCGDGVVDPGEACDGSTGCSSTCLRGGMQRTALVRDAGDVADSDADAAHGGVSVRRQSADCSCRAVHSERSPFPLVASGWPLLLGAWAYRRRSRRDACRAKTGRSLSTHDPLARSRRSGQ